MITPKNRPHTRVIHMTKGRRTALVHGVVVLVLVLLAACSAETSKPNAVPASRASGSGGGAEVYAARCASCHGTNLRGTDKGPSHLSQVYEPGHHPDQSFRSAIANGAKQHHWSFGDMAPVQGITPEETAAVIAYIREVQSREGFEPYQR